jgi:hypothetical protein
MPRAINIYREMHTFEMANARRTRGEPQSRHPLQFRYSANLELNRGRVTEITDRAVAETFSLPYPEFTV